MNRYSKMRESFKLSPPHSSASPNSQTDPSRDLPATGAALSRTCSSLSQRYNASVQGAVKRALMRKSPSKVYWRIHDTWDCDFDGDDEDGEVGNVQQQPQHQQQQQQVNALLKKKSRFIRACKRLFGIKKV